MAKAAVFIAGAAVLGVHAVVVHAPAAQAVPPPPPPPPCSFVISTPAIDGASVSSTVQSTGCAPLAVPYLSVVCVQPGDGAPSCAQAQGTDTALVQVPYLPGQTYVATGRGCAGWVGLPSAPDCQLLGPNPANL